MEKASSRNRWRAFRIYPQDIKLLLTNQLIGDECVAEQFARLKEEFDLLDGVR